MNPKLKSLVIGMAAGALLGATMGWVFGDGKEQADEQGKSALASLGPGDYIKLGISILVLAREFSGMVRRA